MTKTAFMLMIVFLEASLFSQEIIRNPATALNPQAGRTLELEKVWEVPLGPRSFQVLWPLADMQGGLYVVGGELRPFPPLQSALHRTA